MFVISQQEVEWSNSLRETRMSGHINGIPVVGVCPIDCVRDRNGFVMLVQKRFGCGKFAGFLIPNLGWFVIFIGSFLRPTFFCQMHGWWLCQDASVIFQDVFSRQAHQHPLKTLRSFQDTRSRHSIKTVYQDTPHGLSRQYTSTASQDTLKLSSKRPVQDNLLRRYTNKTLHTGFQDTSKPAQDIFKLSRHPFKTPFQDVISRHINTLSRHFEAINTPVQDTLSRRYTKTLHTATHGLPRHINSLSRHFEAMKRPVQHTLSRRHFKTHQNPLKMNLCVVYSQSRRTILCPECNLTFLSFSYLRTREPVNWILSLCSLSTALVLWNWYVPPNLTYSGRCTNEWGIILLLLRKCCGTSESFPITVSSRCTFVTFNRTRFEQRTVEPVCVYMEVSPHSFWCYT